MKKIISITILFLVLILIIFIINIKNDDFEIINESDVYAMNLKEIYKDEHFIYYINDTSVENVFVVFSNKKITLKDALEQKLITPKQAMKKYTLTIKERFKLETLKKEGTTNIHLENQQIYFHDLFFNYYQEDLTKPISLEEALISHLITIEVIIESFENYLVDKTVLKEVDDDLGIIKYSNYEFSIIKCKDNSYHLGNYNLYPNDVCKTSLEK